MWNRQGEPIMLEHGCQVTAIELGSNLAEKARDNLASFSEQFRVVVADFDTVELQDHAYDVLASASAFHWIDPEVGFPRVVELLRPTGILALWGMGNSQGELATAFFDDVRAIYDELGVPQRGGGARPAGGPPREAVRIQESGLFGPVELQRFPREITYSRDQYLQLVASYPVFLSCQSLRRRR